MINTFQVKEFAELTPILNVFCQENQLSNEKTLERIQAFEKNFSKEDSIYFLITVDNIPFGFMCCDITEKIIQVSRLFVKKNERYDELIFELISKTSKQLESLNKEFLQIFFVNNLTLKQKLEENGFYVYERVSMAYNLQENQIPDIKLPMDYQEANFTLDKLDEELQIIVDANKNTIDGEIFRQFSNLLDLKAFFIRSNMDASRLRADSLIVLKEDKIVGVNIVINLTETTSYIWIIALLSEHRGKGLGKYLMLKAHENCKKDNIPQIALDVTIQNETAFNLYKKLGYKENNHYLTVIKKYK